ncbi:MAG: hypothetical protein E6G60_11545 [Actinobacteria bacterium]|nr:MAG: hypothetical protein E6G60_11545 [Actinomycetota bacterium]
MLDQRPAHETGRQLHVHELGQSGRARRRWALLGSVQRRHLESGNALDRRELHLGLFDDARPSFGIDPRHQLPHGAGM